MKKKTIKPDYSKKYKELETKYKILINAFNLATRELYDRTIVMFSDEQYAKFKVFVIGRGNGLNADEIQRLTEKTLSKNTKEKKNDKNGKICSKA